MLYMFTYLSEMRMSVFQLILILLLIVWIIIMIINVRPSQKGYELVLGIESVMKTFMMVFHCTVG